MRLTNNIKYVVTINFGNLEIVILPQLPLARFIFRLHTCAGIFATENCPAIKLTYYSEIRTIYRLKIHSIVCLMLFAKL